MTIIGIYLPICNALKCLEMATGVTFNHGVAGSSSRRAHHQTDEITREIAVMKFNAVSIEGQVSGR